MNLKSKFDFEGLICCRLVFMESRAVFKLLNLFLKSLPLVLLLVKFGEPMA
jgi:hypothetical protein